MRNSETTNRCRDDDIAQRIYPTPGCGWWEKFMHEDDGKASLWLICLIPCLAMIFVIMLGAATVHQGYAHAAKSLSRTVSVSVGQTEKHNTIRDIVTDIPQSALNAGIENNLKALEYTKNGSSWQWQDSYSINNLQASAGSKLLNFTATLNINMPWRLGEAFSVISIPIKGQAHILFLN